MSDCKCRTPIIIDKGPKAIGPYSVGIRAMRFIYTAGQLGIDPQSGNLVPGGVKAETKQALKNLRAILEEGGSSMDHVLKTTVFMKDINDFAKMNAVYSEFFTSDYPARSAVQVAALPKEGLVEIEAVALICGDDCDCQGKNERDQHHNEEKSCCCKYP
jgi:2-iminobutanoate/2-iminopropanoate deaminase